jgi:hypothetical protein
MNAETTLSHLRKFCAEQLRDSELADDVVDLTRRGFDLTRAERPDKTTGHSRFGGPAMLEPGTPWPHCEDFPLSLLAVVDTDALPTSWLDGLLPAGTGLLNFFYLDTDSEQHDPGAFDLLFKYGHSSTQVGRVIPARSAHAVNTEAPARASVFKPIPWAATPGISWPDPLNMEWESLGLVDDDVPLPLPGYYIYEQLTDWQRRPGALSSPDVAFGWPSVRGNGPLLPDGAAPYDYLHLLQLSGEDEWSLGGDGGLMHWSIPVDALRAGDFSQAVPTPALS